ncbi:MAG TPA: Hsp20/alpha crystallin family protein [Candidatus Binatia bacterium]
MARESRELARQERESGGNVVPIRPMAEIARWEREMDRMLGSFLGGRFPFVSDDRWMERLGVREPAVDIYEDGDDLVVKAEMPGLDADDIDVTLTDHLLILRGEKQKEEEVNENDYYRSERVYGAFVRSIPLPAETDTENVRANFKNGVLEIRLPKSEAAKKKEVKINVEGAQEGAQSQQGRKAEGQGAGQQGQRKGEQAQRKSEQGEAGSQQAGSGR